MAELTVGFLRQLIAGVDDALTISIPGGDYDYVGATRASFQTLEWHTDDAGNDLDDGPVDRLTLVIE